MADKTPALVRCHTPHWQGNDFVEGGTVLLAGDPLVIEEFFAPFEPGAVPSAPAPATDTVVTEDEAPAVADDDDEAPSKSSSSRSKSA